MKYTCIKSVWCGDLEHCKVGEWAPYSRYFGVNEAFRMAEKYNTNIIFPDSKCECQVEVKEVE